MNDKIDIDTVITRLLILLENCICNFNSKFTLLLINRCIIKVDGGLKQISLETEFSLRKKYYVLQAMYLQFINIDLYFF